MKLRIFAACAALSTLVAGQALAAPIIVKLNTPVPAKTKFVAGGSIFECWADTCVASAPSAKTFTVAACKAVAGEVGAIQSYTGQKAMEADQLTACNAKAKGAATTIAKQ